MNTVRFPLLRGSLFLIALAAIAFILARGDNPAQATTYNPSFNIKVSDHTPEAAADIVIDFSLDAPDSFPNVRTNPSIQFLPKQWGVNAGAPIGGIAGTFNALSTLGLDGMSPCLFPVPVPFTLYDASTDTSNLASALDLGAGLGPGGGDLHPGGMGFSGQFVDDPLTLHPPADFGLPLVNFNFDAGEKAGSAWAGYDTTSAAYKDVDGDNLVSVGDIRLTDHQPNPIEITPAGEVHGTDPDFGNFLQIAPANVKHDDADGNGQMDIGEHVYKDVDGNGAVSYGDDRLFFFGHLNWGSTVQEFALMGGVSRYPDFLNQLLPPSVVGQPLARMFGAQDVLGNAVPLNIVTYRPGQLEALGYPARLGYPNVVVILNPVAPVDASIINLTSDLCAPLALTSTNLGVSKDNPGTAADEGGYARLTNPKTEKDHTFTLVTTSQPDADNDGQENMLDSCPFDPNTQDLDGRNNGGIAGDPIADPDRDALDAACDPEPGGPPPDYGRRLVRFNWNEKFWGFTCWTCSNGSVIYRDKDYSGNITPGDDRLMVRVVEYNVGATWYSLELQPGVVQDSDADYRDPVTGVVRPTYQRPLLSLQPTSQFNIKHSETVAANWRYDVGEDVYWDKDGSGDVSTGDERLFYEGQRYSNRDNIVEFSGQSPLGPWFHTPDEDLDNFANRADNCPVVPNGIEVVGATYIQLRGLKFNLLTPGDLIGPDNQADTDLDDIGDACEGSEHGSQCANGLDDDGDGSVNDGCPLSGAIGAESGAQCDNALDDDGDGRVNDGCPAVVIEEWGVSSYPWMCSNAVDDDGDGKVNDGCPALSTRGTAEAQCNNNVNDDSPDDSYVNDGCPAVGEAETGGQCGNLADDDGDGRINDGCPVVGSGAETDQCDNATDDDDDGIINDGCPSVDPGDVAKTTITGHMHEVWLTQDVSIVQHGIALKDLNGKNKLNNGGSADYAVIVYNTARTPEDIPVALKVEGGCGAVDGVAGQNTQTVHVNGNSSKTVKFTADWTGCLGGEYIVRADACHAGDPTGLFGSSPCPGTSDVPQPPSAQLSPSGATASSEDFGPEFGAAKAIDNSPDSVWCTAFPAPGVWIEVSLPSPVSVDRVDIEDIYFDLGWGFTAGTLTFSNSNGYTQDVTLATAAETISVAPAQGGVTSVKFTGAADEGAGYVCMSELKIFGFTPVVADTNTFDDAPMAMSVEVGP